MGKPETLIVRAANPEKPVFMPGHPLRQFDAEGRDKWAIRADSPREVPNDVYYRRQVRDGDLIELQGDELRAFLAPTESVEATAASEEE